MPKQKLNRLFKITHLDNSSAIYDNNGNLVMKAAIKQHKTQ